VSDEKFCDMVEIPDALYRKEYPPIEKDNITTNVGVNVSISNIDQLDEIEMKFSVKILIVLQWRDSRVTFYNLKSQRERGNHVSKCEREKLWIPALVFSNSLPAEVQIVNDEHSYLMVQLESKPDRKETTDSLQKNEVYNGSLNSLLYKRYFDLDLRCKYKFDNYPFDQQKCSIEVSNIYIQVLFRFSFYHINFQNIHCL
jgi:hypothetical protein